MRDSPVRRSRCAMYEFASEHHQTSPAGVVQMPSGPRPRGAAFDGDLAGAHRQLADVAALAREPEIAVAVEGAGVEVGVRRALGQRKHADLAVGPADADDRVLPAIGEPRRMVRPLDDAVRRGPRAERDQFRAPGRRLEPAQVTARLRRKEHAAVGRGRDVVDAGVARGGELPGLQGTGLRARFADGQGGGAQPGEQGATLQDEVRHGASSGGRAILRVRPGPLKGRGRGLRRLRRRGVCAPCARARPGRPAPSPARP